MPYIYFQDVWSVAIAWKPARDILLTNLLWDRFLLHIDLLNKNPLDKKNKDFRKDLLIGNSGIANCSNVQNCKSVCPKEIPITEAISELGRVATKHFLKKIFKKKSKA